LSTAFRFVGIFVGIGGKNVHGVSLFQTKGIEQMARKNDGAGANPKQIKTYVDCRAARPKFDKGAGGPSKISDVTGGARHAGQEQARQRCLLALADTAPHQAVGGTTMLVGIMGKFELGPASGR
jgi:hypothetical protein